MAGNRILNLGSMARMLTDRAQQAIYSSKDQTPSIASIPANAWPNPLQPVKPFGPPGSKPLNFPFFEGQNLNFTARPDAEYTSSELRSLATYPLARICIDNVKDIVCQTKWTIGLKPFPGETQKERAKRQKGDDNIVNLSRFFEYPDGVTDWPTWSRGLIENLLTIDAASILVERSKRGKVAVLRVIDGASISRYIDDRGLTPLAPDKAYAQLWYGQPRVDFTTDELLYGVRNIVPRDNISSYLYGLSPTEAIATEIKIGIERLNFTLAYYCYSDDTEVFTRRGWIKFEDATMQDEFASREKHTGVFEWQRPTELFRKHYDGEMIHFGGKSLDLLVTPNHRMLVSSLPQKLKRKRTFKEKEYVVSAEDLLAYGNSSTPIPQTSMWAGKELGDIAFVSHNKRSNSLKMTGDQFCAFMGMYLAEGSTKKYKIQISQPEDARGSRKLYESLLRDIFPSVYCGENDLEVSNGLFAAYLRQFGHAEDKYVPEEILSATPRQLQIFWDYYYAGDGAVNSGERKCYQAFTVSKKLEAHLCEVVQKLGRAVTTWTRPAGIGKVQGRLVAAREGYMVTSRSAPKAGGTKFWKAKRVEYHGPVCCVTVPSSFLFVRRNGKTAWSGNTSGSIPDVIQIAPPGINPDQIKEAMTANNAVLSGNLARRRQWTILQGFQKDGKTEQILFPKEQLLIDPFDEAHIRKVAYAYGDSPQRLQKMMNRSASDSNQTASEEEGITPWVVWLQAILNRAIQKYMLMEDYEITFKQERESDIKKLMETDVGYVKNGLYSINERRESRGDDPRPEPEADELGIVTANGFMKLGSMYQAAPSASDSGDGDSKPAPSSSSEKALRLVERGAAS